MRDFGINTWGGLGLLYRDKHIKGAYMIYYCPSFIGSANEQFGPDYYWANGNPDNNTYYIVWSWYVIRNAWAHDGQPHTRGDGNGRIQNMNNKIAVWDSTHFGKRFMHKKGYNVAYYDGHVGFFDDPAKQFNFDVWDGGPNHFQRAQILFDAMDLK
jgi:prepilin-type processing-associated H-X9-DG protein